MNRTAKDLEREIMAELAKINSPEGSHDKPIRYKKLDRKNPLYKAEFKNQLAQFEKDASAGKVLCLSDIMINAGM